MAADLVGAFGEMRAASAAGGGTALSTTAAYIAIPVGTKRIYLTTRNYATAVVAQYFLNPYLVVVRTTDNLVTGVDYSAVAQDGDATTEVVMDDQDVAANGDYLYVGSHQPFGGVYVDVSGDANEANGTSSVITVNYWNGSAWVNITATDGTISGTASLGTDGAVTWTVPTTWQSVALRDTLAPVPGSTVPQRGEKLYWTRWQWSVQMDALVRLDAMYAINRSSAYAELVSGQTVDSLINQGMYNYGCVQAKTDAGTASIIVNVAADKGGSLGS